MIDVHHVQRMRPGQMVQAYLLASYCYYWLDLSPLTDHAFDLLARQLLACYDEIEHQHKDLITKSDLKMGTLLLTEDKYPGIIRNPVPILDEQGKMTRWVDSNAKLFYEKAISGELARTLEGKLHPVGTIARLPTAEQLALFDEG